MAELTERERLTEREKLRKEYPNWTDEMLDQKVKMEWYYDTYGVYVYEIPEPPEKPPEEPHVVQLRTARDCFAAVRKSKARQEDIYARHLCGKESQNNKRFFDRHPNIGIIEDPNTNGGIRTRAIIQCPVNLSHKLGFRKLRHFDACALDANIRLEKCFFSELHRFSKDKTTEHYRLCGMLLMFKWVFEKGWPKPSRYFGILREQWLEYNKTGDRDAFYSATTDDFPDPYKKWYARGRDDGFWIGGINSETWGLPRFNYLHDARQGVSEEAKKINADDVKKRQANLPDFYHRRYPVLDLSRLPRMPTFDLKRRPRTGEQPHHLKWDLDTWLEEEVVPLKDIPKAERRKAAGLEKKKAAFKAKV